MANLGILFLATLLPGGALGQEGPPAEGFPPGVTPELIERGGTLFTGLGGCSNCHGADARGLLGPDLTDDDWWHAKGSFLELVTQILNGVPVDQSTSGTAMAPRGGSGISEEEVMAVAAYIWTLSHPERGDSLPMGVTEEIVRLGDRVFHGPGDCMRCHGGSAEGGIGPNLKDENWLHAKGSYLSIVQTILAGVPAERSRTGVIMPPKGGANLSDEEVHAVAAYVWYVSRAYDPGAGHSPTSGGKVPSPSRETGSGPTW
jgi:cbb3-type cytochrome c oxidase subunit III